MTKSNVIQFPSRALSPEAQALKDEVMEYAAARCVSGGCPGSRGGDHDGACMLYVDMDME